MTGERIDFLAVDHDLDALDGRQVGGGQMAGAGLAFERARDRGPQCGVRMAEARGAPGRGEVQQPAAIVRDELGAVAADHRLREEPQEGHG